LFDPADKNGGGIDAGDQAGLIDGEQRYPVPGQFISSLTEVMAEPCWLIGLADGVFGARMFPSRCVCAWLDSDK